MDEVKKFIDEYSLRLDEAGIKLIIEKKLTLICSKDYMNGVIMTINIDKKNVNETLKFIIDILEKTEEQIRNNQEKDFNKSKSKSKKFYEFWKLTKSRKKVKKSKKRIHKK